MTHFLAQAEELLKASPLAQLGIGGAALLIFARFLARLEVIFSSRMDNIEHGQRNLSKAIWMLLAELSTAGSFVREEAKRMVEKDKLREQLETMAVRDRTKAGPKERRPE